MSSKALQAGFWYTVGNIMIKGINFLTLPLFSRIMTTQEFGLYNIFLSYDAIVFVIIGFALHSSVRSANIEFPKKIDEYVSSIILIYILNFVFLFFTVVIGREWLSSVLGISSIILIFIVFHGFGSAILMLFNTWLSINYSYKKYIIVALINSFGNIVLSLVIMLTVFSNDKGLGRILGGTIVIFLLSLVLICFFFKNSKPVPNFKYLHFGIVYSAPIVPHGISQVLLGQFDRIMIHSIINISAAAIFSLAGNLRTIMTVITSSISTSWSTWFFQQMHEKKYSIIQEKAGALLNFYTIIIIIMLSIVPELILVLGGQSYDIGKFVAIPMLIDTYVLFIYNLIIPAEYYFKKTKYIMMGTVLSAVINVVANLTLIKIYGFYIAAYNTLGAYIIYLFIHIYICKKVAGFFIVKVQDMLKYSLVLFFVTLIDLFFIDNLFFRWSLCFIIIYFISKSLYFSYGEKYLHLLLRRFDS